MYKNINMSSAIELIKAVGTHTTVLVQGEMGIGKSSKLKTLSGVYPNHIASYVDITTKDVGDFMIPQIRQIDGTPVCSFIPNEEFGFHLNKPIIIMLDEIGKASRGVLNACLRLMLERKLGTHTLPEGSIVFGTTNLSIEGIGDNLPPHARNRVISVKVRKPTAEEWRMEYAIHNEVDPIIIATVSEYPQMLASFEEYDTPSNEYIFDPRKPMASFVTPRSLVAASNILKSCRHLDESVLAHALIGAVGERAAMDIMTITKLDASIPSWKEIVSSPGQATIPTNGAAACLIINKALMNVSKDTFDPFMQYLARLSREAQALFALSVMSKLSPKRSIAVKNKLFTQYCVDNGYLF